MDRSDRGETGIAGWRGRRGVAASILGVVLVAGYFVAPSGDAGALPGRFLVDAAILLVAFWFPAMRIGSVGDLLRQWRPLVLWLLAWTLVWDLATSGIWGQRSFLQEWWLVYPSGLVVLGALLALHGAIVGHVERPR